MQNFFKTLAKVFTTANLSKAFIIIYIGFSLRALLKFYFDINVFLDYLNPISIVYYSFMAFFLAFMQKLSFISPKVFTVIFFKKAFIIFILGFSLRVILGFFFNIKIFIY